MAAIATAEACDSNAALMACGDLRVLQLIFKIYGQISGPVVTLKVFEDNVLVRELMESRGEGRVLVVDGGESMRCFGGRELRTTGSKYGVGGYLVNGCIRDIDEVNGCDIGVRALASHPVKSNKKGVGEKHVPDGEWLYADSDGILLSKSELCI